MKRMFPLFSSFNQYFLSASYIPGNVLAVQKYRANNLMKSVSLKETNNLK